MTFFNQNLELLSLPEPDEVETRYQNRFRVVRFFALYGARRITRGFASGGDFCKMCEDFLIYLGLNCGEQVFQVPTEKA